ncbi:MAG: choice-of-anchor tandem repeat GloVer-containing protein [Terriglobales bacterium]
MTLFVAIVGVASVAPAQVNETVLYSFQGGSDGEGPVGGIVFDKAGDLYGVTSHTDTCLSTFECGSVYELSPPQQPSEPWTETTLYVFQGHENGDGGAPDGGLIQDAGGNLYGTTAYGGVGPCILLGSAVGCGTVFELIRPAKPGGKWIEKVLYSFRGNQDGQFPLGDLVFDKLGNLYGATSFGGGRGDTCNPFYPYCGTIFELMRPRTTARNSSWTEKVLYSFAGVETRDGANPNGGLIFDAKGTIYGTTFIGGYDCPHNSGQGCGTAFKLSSPDRQNPFWTEAVLYQFTNVPDGQNPNGNLIIDRGGNLYGTTVNGGGSTFPSGTAFELVLQPNGAFAETILYNFDEGADGGLPRAGLVFDSEDNLYGTTTLGGTGRGGTIFRILAKTGALQPVYQFQVPPDGFSPESRLTFDAAGNLYGTTLFGGSGQACANYGCGTVFMAGP